MPNNILLLDRELVEGDELNLDEVLLRMGLEDQKQNVITVHCSKDNPPRLVTMGKDRYIIAKGCESNASQYINVVSPKNKDFYLKTLEKRLREPRPGLKVEQRNGDYFVIYPDVRIRLSEVNAAACIACTLGIEPSAEQALELLTAAEEEGIVSLNSTEAIETANSKIKSYKKFIEYDVPVPKTVCFQQEEGFDEERCKAALEEIGTNTFVVKGEHGYMGKRVYFAENKEEAIEAIRNIKEMGDGVVVQEEIAPPNGSERNFFLRVTVLDNKIIGIGGRGFIPEPDIPPEEQLSKAQAEAAIRAAKASGLRVAGVDLGGTASNPVVFEVNENGGLIVQERRGQGPIAKVVNDFIGQITAKKQETARVV